MSTIEAITEAIERLPADQVAQLQAWLAEYAERRWDEQIERDEKAGKLDALIDKALDDHQTGRTYHKDSVQRQAELAAEFIAKWPRVDPDYSSPLLQQAGRLHFTRPGSGCRNLAADGPAGPIWFWIGSRVEYNLLIDVA